MVLPTGEVRFDPGIDVLQVGLTAAGKVGGSGALGDELQAGSPGQHAAVTFDQQQVVIGGIAAIEIALVPGSRELLPVGGFAQDADRIGHGGEPAAFNQMQIQAVDGEQHAAGLLLPVPGVG